MWLILNWIIIKKITNEHGLIEDKERLKLYFDYDKEVIALVKTIPGARWDKKEKCWHVSVPAGPVEKGDVLTSYQNQSINAIKFYYEQVLGRPVLKMLFPGQRSGRK